MNGRNPEASGAEPLPPVDHIERTRRLYAGLGYPAYRWVRSETPPPWRTLRRPLAESRVALIGSGGVYRLGQPAFHHRDDSSLRQIESSTTVSELRATHFAYDLTGARRDPNCVFPLEPLRRAAASGRIGELAASAWSLMGGIYSARRVREQVAPELGRQLGREEVDVALLVPV